MEADAAKGASQQDLEILKNKAREVFAVRQRVEELNKKLYDEKQRLNDLVHKEMPELMDSKNVGLLGLPDLGVVLECVPYYKANISSDWPDEKRERAFNWLEKNGHGDIIRITVSVSFGRTENKKAHALVKWLRKKGFDPETEYGVPWNTLTAWLQEQIEVKKKTPPLEMLGATVGRVVKIKQNKEK